MGNEGAGFATLKRMVPYLALAIKSVALARIWNADGNVSRSRRRPARARRTDSARRCRQNRAVVWFSDLRGFTRITDTAPEQAIPLLNADVVVSATHEHGGDVLKLIGDGTLAIFTAADRAQACTAALSAAIATREGIVALNKRQQADGKSITDMYLGLHRGRCFLRQCRGPRTARLYRDWAGGERGKPHCRDVPFSRSARSDVFSFRQCRRR
jgi:adenylate cyclase